MKRFFIVFALTFFVLFCAAWYWVANDYMKFADSDYPIWAAKKLMLDDCNVGVLSVVGDSQAQAGIVPQKVGPGVVNFGLAGASPVTMLDVSRRILACPEPPKAVVLSMSLDQFAGIDLFWKREVKYGLFDIDLEEARRRARKFEDMTIYDPPAPFDFDMRVQEVLLQARFPSYYFGSLLAGYGYRREESNLGFMRDTLTDKGYHFFGVQAVGDNRIGRIAYQRSFASSPFIESYLDDMLDLYAQHNIPVYFVSAPIKLRAFQAMTAEFKQGYVEYIERLTRLYPNFHLLGDSLPVMPPDDFNDAAHLNVLGAVVWSTNLATMLQEAGVDTGGYRPFYQGM